MIFGDLNTTRLFIPIYVRTLFLVRPTIVLLPIRNLHPSQTSRCRIPTLLCANEEKHIILGYIIHEPKSVCQWSMCGISQITLVVSHKTMRQRYGEPELPRREWGVRPRQILRWRFGHGWDYRLQRHRQRFASSHCSYTRRPPTRIEVVGGTCNRGCNLRAAIRS